jgi:preprotein translocase subunit SecE
MADKLKIIVSLLLVAGSIGAFYYYGDQSLLMRVLGLLFALALVTYVMMQTTMGRGAWAFAQDAQIELKKVVWPTRKETIQTTLIVMGMVVVIAIFLWLLDMLLVWAVRSITG